MPPSKWNDNINWDDLKGQRLDYIIRSIYNATVERDYWYRVMSVNQFDPKAYVASQMNNNEFLNKNSLREIQVIFEIFERWLRPYSKIKTDYDGQFLDMYGLCVFVDDFDSGVADAPNVVLNGSWGYDRIYGRGNYDYATNGNLSTLVNYDLSFIETGYIYGEINGDHLRAFYNILNLDLKNRCFPLQWDGVGQFFKPKSFKSSIPIDNLIYGVERKYKRVQILDDNYSQLVTDFNNESYDENPVVSGTLNIDGYDFVNTNTEESNTLRSLYSATYIHSSDFKGFSITDFNTDSYYNIEEIREASEATNFSYTTFPPVSKKIANNLLNLNGVDCVYSLSTVDEILVQSVGAVAFPKNLTNIERKIMPQLFIDLNKEGFLSYYTETP